MNNETPWWVPYAFIAVLVAGSFVFTVLGRMSPAEWLAFAAALGFRAPQASSNSGTVERMDVASEVTNVVEEKPAV